MSSRAQRLVGVVAAAPLVWPTDPGTAMVAVPARLAPVVEVQTPAVEAAAHEAQIAAAEREAFARGHAEGERAAAQQVDERTEALLRRLSQTLDDLAATRAHVIQRTERQMVQLALAVARRIVRREVTIDQDLLVAMARVALERLGDRTRVTVHFHPDEYAATAEARRQQLEAGHVTVVADPSVARGGCRLESDFGEIDAGVDAQMHELARALLGEGEGTHDAVAH